jgi:hypothetical protein
MTEDRDYTAHDDQGTKPLMVHVRAPANLPAGYTFEALLNDDPDRPFTCEVVRSIVTFLSPTKDFPPLT